MTYNLKEHITPYKYQIRGAEFALSHEYCIIGDSPGLGKTLQGIMLDQKLRSYKARKTLIVAPAFLRETWKQEYLKLSKFEGSLEILKTTKKVQESTFENDIEIISYNAIVHAEELFKKADLIIFDEIHKLKSIDTKWTIASHEFISEYRPLRVLGLSGTPITKDVGDWYSLIKLMGYNPMNTSGINLNDVSVWQFKSKFMLQRKLNFGGRSITKYYGVQNVEGLKKLLKYKYIRRLAEDNLELPPAINKEVIASYKSNTALGAQWDAFLQNTDKDVTAKRDSAVAKVKFTIDYAKDLLEQGELPLVIFTDHVDSAKQLAEALKMPLIIGATPMDKRNDIVKDFQAGKLKGVVASIGAAKEGLTLTKSWNCVFNDLPWLSSTLAQAKKRIDRITQTRSPVFHFIVGSKQDAHITAKLIENARILELAS